MHIHILYGIFVVSVKVGQVLVRTLCHMFSFTRVSHRKRTVLGLSD